MIQIYIYIQNPFLKNKYIFIHFHPKNKLTTETNKICLLSIPVERQNEKIWTNEEEREREREVVLLHRKEVCLQELEKMLR